MNNALKLIECPRDAWQGLKGHIPAPVKAEYLRALINAGFKHIDAVSFVSPKAVPQMADSEEVLKQLEVPNKVEIIGIVVNEKGVARAAATEKVTTVGFPYSVSETFLQQNQRQTAEEAMDVLEKVKEKAEASGLDVVVYISMAFGNPYGDAWNLEEVLEAVSLLEKTDIHMISLADTVGLATPEQVSALVAAVMRDFNHLEIGVHLHSRRESARENVLAAYDAGCRRFDSAIGGLGGCPFAQDELVGNIPTEVVVEVLREKNRDVPVLDQIAKLIALTNRMPVQYGRADSSLPSE